MVDWLYLGSVVAFVIVLVAILFIDRKNIKRDSILILRKTQKGKKLLKRVGERFPRGWKVFGMIGVFVTFGASIYGVYFLLNTIATAIVVEQPIGGLSFVVPSPTPDVVVIPGAVAIPFWHLLISLALLIIVHEGSHGLMAVRERVPIKSVGAGLLLILPLAFVEPDEKILAKRGKWPQLRVFAAGSFANFIVAGLVLLISFLLFSGMFTPGGVAFAGYEKGYPAEKVNLTGVIVNVNGQEVKTREDLKSIMKGIKPNEEIEIVTKNYDNKRNIIFKTFKLTTAERLDENGKPTGEAFIGIRGVLDGSDISKVFPPVYLFVNPDFGLFFDLNENLHPYSGVIYFLLSLLGFIFIINFGVGLVNMLPIKPLDGGRMWEIVFKQISPERAGAITHAVGAVTLLIVIAAFIVPYII